MLRQVVLSLPAWLTLDRLNIHTDNDGVIKKVKHG